MKTAFHSFCISMMLTTSLAAQAPPGGAPPSSATDATLGAAPGAVLGGNNSPSRELSPAPETDLGQVPAATNGLSVRSVLPGMEAGLHYHPMLLHAMAAQRWKCQRVAALLIQTCIREEWAAQARLHHLPATPFWGKFAELGDLELVSVSLVADGGPECGPRYAVAVLNNSPIAVGDFHISLVAAVKVISADSPCVSVHVDEIPARQTAVLEVQLPPNALMMTPAGAAPIPFCTLIAAIDSFDELVESSELNNVMVIRREQIPPVGQAVIAAPGGVAPAAATPGTIASPGAQVSPGAQSNPGTPPAAGAFPPSGAPDRGASPGPPPSTPSPDAMQGPTKSPPMSPEIDFDNLNFGETKPASALLVR